VALGVAFEAQRVPEAAADEQDRQLDGFVTERKVYRGTDEFEL
jgi:5-formyltetrahydrofolate cyclo-ligase